METASIGANAETDTLRMCIQAVICQHSRYELISLCLCLLISVQLVL